MKAIDNRDNRLKSESAFVNYGTKILQQRLDEVNIEYNQLLNLDFKGNNKTAKERQLFTISQIKKELEFDLKLIENCRNLSKIN